MSEPTKPIVRLDNGMTHAPEFDELFASGDIHVERMSTRSFWIGIDTASGHICINTGVAEGKWYFNVEEDWNGGKRYEIERPACHRKHTDA